MSHDITAEDILLAIQRRQQRSGLGTEVSLQSRDVVLARELVPTREVCKDIKIERYKQSSRVNSEDENVSKDLLRKPLEEVLPQEDFGNVITPASCSSRYSGISVQHCRTRKGVKLAITLQQPSEAASGACLRLTAELKRYDRLHEVRARPEDGEWFRQLLTQTQQDIRSSANRSACLGRIHDRGRRSEWFLDSLVVGFLQDDCIRRVLLNLEGEEYIIELDQELSPRQQELYHSTCIQGHISKGREAQRRLATAQRVAFGE